MYPCTVLSVCVCCVPVGILFPKTKMEANNKAILETA